MSKESRSTQSDTYAVLINDSWELFCAIDTLDLILLIAEYTGDKSSLFAKALKGCECDRDYVEMYNRFSKNTLFCIYKLGDVIFED